VRAAHSHSPCPTAVSLQQVTECDTFRGFVTFAQVFAPPPMAFSASRGRVGLQNVTLFAFLSPSHPAKKSPVAAKTGGGTAVAGLDPAILPAAPRNRSTKGRVPFSYSKLSRSLVNNPPLVNRKKTVRPLIGTPRTRRRQFFRLRVPAVFK
jgi:hypothetical protein